MVTFITSLVLLFAGYFFYGRLIERVFAPDRRRTPAYTLRDDVDYIPLKTWKATMIQLLNIAGTGPIFGALMGACFGPIVFLWIVLGSILGGAVHDYMSGMISERHKGRSIAELSGLYLGPVGLYAMRIFSVLLLLLTGAVFISTPAMLLAKIFPRITYDFWIFEILFYYLLATLLPIDRIIGWIYPIFGAVLSIMAVLVMGALLLSPDYTLPELTLANLHPKDLPVWPYMFVTLACGAISGFHATQSPMMAKCMRSEFDGRKIFYGAMILEAVIALIWAAAGISFYGSVEGLSAGLDGSGPSGAVFFISNGLLSKVGAVLAVLGVVVCPITSGDTSFRVVRMIVAEWFGIDQKPIAKRLATTLPLIVVGGALTQVDFSALWRYFAWSNQTLATVALWVATAYLIRHEKYRFSSIFTAVPATFMTAVVTTYILVAPEGLKLPTTIGYTVGAVCAVLLFVVYSRHALRAPEAEPIERASGNSGNSGHSGTSTRSGSRPSTRPGPSDESILASGDSWFQVDSGADAKAGAPKTKLSAFADSKVGSASAEHDKGFNSASQLLLAGSVAALLVFGLMQVDSPDKPSGKQYELAVQKQCMTCHQESGFAPSFSDVAARYTRDHTTLLAGSITGGSQGHWGGNACPPKDDITTQEAISLAIWILGQKPQHPVVDYR